MLGMQKCSEIVAIDRFLRRKKICVPQLKSKPGYSHVKIRSVTAKLTYSNATETVRYAFLIAGTGKSPNATVEKLLIQEVTDSKLCHEMGIPEVFMDVQSCCCQIL
jgi:hypothetical protein